MIVEFTGIFAGFVKSLIDRSKWYNNLINEKLYNKLLRFNFRKVKNIPEDNYEAIYKTLVFKYKMENLTLIEILTIHFLITALSTLIIVILLNIYIPALKIYDIIIPQWALFLIGYFVGLIYSFIFRKF